MVTIDRLKSRFSDLAAASRRSALKIVPILGVVLITALIGYNLKPHPHAATTVTGQGYEICSDPSQLTSPYSYHALSSGSQSYTVAQYEALTGYGTTLPSLPSYIASEPSTTEAAVIYAPGSTVDTPAYDFPMTPIVNFFEGGAYTNLGLQSVSGDEFIGGTTTGYIEPTFNNGGNAEGIDAQNDSYGYLGGANGTPAIGHVTTAAAQGATSVTVSATTIPLVQWGNVAIGGSTYEITAISGSESAGYTLTVQGLDVAVAANTSVYYDNLAGNVTVEYLDINNDQHTTTGTIYTGAGWTIEHNNIHDGNSNGPGSGVAIYGGDQGTIEYNCMSKMGDYGINVFGTNNKFDYNEIYESNYKPDPGCGCSGAGKWWGTLNADIVGNAFINDGYAGGIAVWLDNGNSGTLIQGNYFDKTYGNAISSETGFNLDITGNLFQDDNWGDGTGCGNSNCSGDVSMNSSGGFHVPNSRYDNSISISANQFIDDWGGVGIWQSGGRSCENSGEGWPNDAGYCSGGYPNTAINSAGGQYYFSHLGDSVNGNTLNVAQAASAGSTTVVINGSEATNDQIGFADEANTTTSDTTNMTTFTGSGIVHVASLSGFPSSGQIRVQSSATWIGGGSWTGGILSYTGTSTSTSVCGGTSTACFTGVNLVRGTGSLASGSPVLQVQPYKVTGETCYANDCSVTITPGLSGAVAANAEVSNAGTCQLFATAAATPTSPIAPGGSSYWDGCQWGTKNISVSGNTFQFDPAAISAGTTVTGNVVGTGCDASHTNDCGTNFMAFQEAGQPPFSSFIGGNAMMSNSNLTGCPSWDSGCTTNPLKNLNALSNAVSAPANNGESANNDVWSNNTYTGPWQWNTDWYGNCNQLPTDPTTNKSMTGNACNINFATWQSDWEQDQGSSYSATTTPAPATPNNVNATANSSSNVTVTWSASSDSGGPGLGGYYILRNGTQVGTVNASTTTYNDNTASASTQYSYTVEAYDTSSPAIVSAASAAAVVTTPAAPGSPTVSITAPTSGGSIFGGAFNVTATATPSGGNTISQVQLLINGTVVQTLTSSPYTFTVNTAGYNDGGYTLAVTATDNQSHVTTQSETVYITNGDFNGSRTVGISDLAIMAGNYGKQSGATYNQGDLNSDGKVNVQDLSILARNWGQQW